uniref:GMP synthase [glutamine-hydrolyzing] n=1 Tax=Candidatus Aschnera chinzeii TaxID=1485666 RepID=A0AAT9G4D5_9ENTR|nr:MAG: glutamine-hydrolyzing GMP synthase [Candidatus Aschnera chinzeii]
MKNISIRNNNILIINFGSQYTQLIAKRIRAIGVYCEIKSHNIMLDDIYEFNPSGIILSGGPASILDDNSPRLSKDILNIGIPILGICYGMQLMCVQLGGKVIISSVREFGYSEVFLQKKCKLFDGIFDNFNLNTIPFLKVWMSHGDQVVSVPLNFDVIGSTQNCKIAIMSNDEKKLYGIQFHPEVTHTVQGNAILRKFVIDICKCKIQWTTINIIDNIKQSLSDTIGTDHVILGLSGGIDSFVTALLLKYVIKNEQLTCIFVNNGLLRQYEMQYVKEILNKYDFNILYIDAEVRFLNALKGIKDPELKRKIIGHLFIDIFNEQANKIDNIIWLAQGTIYSDIIESQSNVLNGKYVIKSHHNVGGIPKNMKLKLIEPLKHLFKDEVKQIALQFGLSYDIINRHPFPGPGLGIRILGEVKKKFCNILRKADYIFIEELHKANLYYKLSQAFVVFLPLCSVGVVGDHRQYNWVLCLRAIETIDFMTARWANLPHDFLSHVSTRIINEVKGVSRVLYDITGKPPATIEWE